MRAHGIEKLAAAVIIGGATFVGCNYPRPFGEIQLPPRTPIAGPAIPGPTVVEQERAEPTSAELLMRNPFFSEWRGKTIDGVVIRDYGPNRRVGKVLSNIGLRTRVSPTTDSLESFFGRLRWGEPVNWRFQITVGEDVWIVQNEHLVVPIIIETPGGGRRETTTPAFNTLDVEEAQRQIESRRSSLLIGISLEQRFIDGSFAALKVRNETLIEAGAEPPDPLQIVWPRAA